MREQPADVVVVGAGTAGCILAARLTEDPSVVVTLVEAGGDVDEPRSRIPAGFPAAFGTRLDWGFVTEPEAALRSRRLAMPRGRGVGGSSAINAMIHNRGCSDDFDRWRCPGWTRDALAACFAQIEPPERQCDPHPLSLAFVESAVADGCRHRDPLVAADGAGLFAVDQRRGRRHGARDVLAEAASRPNLRLVCNALVDRIAWDADRAIGVHAVVDGVAGRIDARRRVVLAAGAIGSPAILLRSGVGSAQASTSLGIAAIADRPEVGRGLQDHPIVGVVFRTHGTDTRDRVWRTIDDPAALQRWHDGGGPLTSNIAEAGAFLDSGSGLAAPDLQLHFSPLNYVQHGFVDLGPGCTIGVALLSPQSRGRVELAARDPAVAPRIIGGYLSDRREVDAMCIGIDRVRAITARQPLASLLGRELLPGRHAHRRGSLAGFVRWSAELLYHPVGTCRMGTDADAVVDTTLAVNGVTGLSVVDASVMPLIPRGNTNVPTAVIAERGARLVAAAL